MTYLIWLGTAAGLVAGLFHAAHLFHARTAQPVAETTAHAAYRALWAVGLWTLFGAYLLVLGLVGSVLLLAFGRPHSLSRPANAG